MPPTPFPADITAKLARAERLIAELVILEDDFADALPFVLYPAQEPGGLAGSWGVRGRELAEPPLDVSIVVGDVVHNLRSVLEYLARALVVTAGNEPVDNGGRGRPSTQFPITYSADTSRVDIAGGIYPDALDIVRAAQPGPDGELDRHPLWLIRELSNEDKHRAPLIISGGMAAPAGVSIRTTGKDPHGVIMLLARWLSDGDWGAMPFFPAAEGIEVVVDSTISARISLPTDRPVKPRVSEELAHLVLWTRHILLPQFEPFFLKPWPEELTSMKLNALDDAAALAALDPGRAVAIVQELVDRCPEASDGTKRFFVMGLAPGINADPRIPGVGW